MQPAMTKHRIEVIEMAVNAALSLQESGAHKARYVPPHAGLLIRP